MPYKFNPFTGTFDDSTPGPAGTVSAAGSGTAAAPGIAFSADPNTGIYNPAADNLAISTGGTGRLFIDASGNVGLKAFALNYAANATNLQVNGSAYGSVTLGTTDAGTAEKYWRWIARTASPAKVLVLQTVDDSGGNEVNAYTILRNGTAIESHAWNTGGFERLRITAAGNVGIGTNSPGWLLSLRQDSGGVTAGNYPAIQINNANAVGYAALYLNDSTAQAGLETRRDTAHLGFHAGGSEKARITSAGNVGIGIATPQHKLQVSGGSLCVDGFSDSANAYISFREGFSPSAAGGTGFRAIDHSGLNADGLGCYGADGISFYTFALERARIDSSGRLLVGTSSARSNFFNTSNTVAVQVEGTSYQTGSLALIATGNSSFDQGTLVLAKGRGGAVGANSIVQSGDATGYISFQGNDGSEFVECAVIKGEVDGAPGANVMPGRLVFSTNSGVANASPTPRMTITSGGVVGIGTTAPTTSYMVTVAGDAPGTGAGGIVAKAPGAGDANFLSESDTIGFHFYGIGAASKQFYVENDGDVRNSNNSYGAISDQKLKQDIEDAASQWQDIKSIQVRKFRFKTNPEEALHIGLIAQEVEQVSPGLVDELLDRDEEGNETGDVTKSVKYSVLYMKAIKALQEAMERIETLEAKVTALESK
jgi:hypothetical protein